MLRCFSHVALVGTLLMLGFGYQPTAALRRLGEYLHGHR